MQPVRVEISSIALEDTPETQALCPGLAPFADDQTFSLASFLLPLSREDGLQASELSYAKRVNGELGEWSSPSDLDFVHYRDLARTTLLLMSNKHFCSKIEEMRAEMKPGMNRGAHRLLVSRNCAMIHACSDAMLELHQSKRLSGALRNGRIAKIILKSGGSSHHRLSIQKEIDFHTSLLSDTVRAIIKDQELDIRTVTCPVMS